MGNRSVRQTLRKKLEQSSQAMRQTPEIGEVKNIQPMSRKERLSHQHREDLEKMLPGILNQLGAESLTHLKRLASNVTGGGVGGAMEAANNMEEEDDDEVPDLVENFDEVSKNEAATEDAKISEVTATE